MREDFRKLLLGADGAPTTLRELGFAQPDGLSPVPLPAERLTELELAVADVTGEVLDLDPAEVLQGHAKLPDRFAAYWEIIQRTSGGSFSQSTDAIPQFRDGTVTYVPWRKSTAGGELFLNPEGTEKAQLATFSFDSNAQFSPSGYLALGAVGGGAFVQITFNGKRVAYTASTAITFPVIKGRNTISVVATSGITNLELRVRFLDDEHSKWPPAPNALYRPRPGDSPGLGVGQQGDPASAYEGSSLTPS